MAVWNSEHWLDVARGRSDDRADAGPRLDILGGFPLIDHSALLDLAHDAIFARDRCGRITYWNGGAERTYGYGRAEAEGRLASRLLVTAPPLPMEELEAVVAAEGHWEGELVHHHRDGHPITVEARIAVYRDAGGEVLGSLEVCRDISARKALEGELARRVTELEGSERQLAEAQAIAHLGSWEWDTAAGRARCSAELVEILGEDAATFVPTYDGSSSPWSRRPGPAWPPRSNRPSPRASPTTASTGSSARTARGGGSTSGAVP